MLSVPTLWTVFVVNFLALSLIWAYVMRSYPKLEAARFWTASASIAVLGGLISILRQQFDSLLPLIAGGTLMVFAACLAAMGVARFYGRPVGLAQHRADYRWHFRRTAVLRLWLR